MFAYRPRVESLEARELLSYALTDLGTFGGASSQALRLNERGQVLIQAHDAGGGNAGYFLSNGRLVHVPTPPDGFYAALPITLANNGQTAGGVFDPDAAEYPAMFGQDGDPGTTLDGNGMVSLLNASGDAVVVNGGTAALWRDGSFVATLPAFSNVRGINDTGLIVGFNLQSPAKWLDGEMTLLPLPDGINQGASLAVSSDGRIAGQVYYFDDQGHFHEDGGTWDADGFRDLGAFIPRGINSAGTIVADDGLRDANGFHPWSELWPTDGWSGESAVGINDRGQIAGTARAPDGQYHAYLLTLDRSFELAIALSYCHATPSAVMLIP